MNVSRNFILVGAVYLALGIVLGMYMGATGNHTPSVAHAHINLLGFTLMAVFGILYKIYPVMAASKIATAHFWLHLVGSVVLLIMLFSMTMGWIAETQMAPIAPIAEFLVLLGVLAFLWNVVRYVK